ncbi:tetratricopeptide repeat protein 28-like [Stylophora pistillata]|nr:tetratricopeptide repeat protein 28-like [Stylophora pistillata]
MYHEHALNIAKEVRNKAGEGKSYSSLGNAYHELEQFQTAIKYHELSLDVAKEVGDKDREGKSYCNLGNAYGSLGESQTAIKCYKHALNIAKEVRNKVVVAKSYCNLGFAYNRLGQFQTAIKYNEHALNIAKDVGNKDVEVKSYCNLGNAYHSLGNFQTAIKYYEHNLNIHKEVGDRVGEGNSYGNLGNAYEELGQFQTAIEYYELSLIIAKEVGDKDLEGTSYCNLGKTYEELGQFQTATKYLEHALKIAEELGKKSLEEKVYGNLGVISDRSGKSREAIKFYGRALNITKEVGDKGADRDIYFNIGIVHRNLREFQKAIEYYELSLNIAKEEGNKNIEGKIFCNLGLLKHRLGNTETAVEYFVRASNITKEVGDKLSAAKSLLGLGETLCTRGNLHEAFNCFHSSLLMLHEIRANFQSKEEWKISFRDTSVDSYTPLWQLHLKLGEEVLALHTAEQGRAEALRDLLELKYGYEEEHCQSFSPQKSTITLLSCLPPNTVFIAVDHGTIFYWVVQNGKEVTFRANRVNNYISKEEVTIFIEMVLGKIGMKVHVKDEDRSYFETCDQRGKNDFLYSNPSPEDILKKLYEIVIAPIEDLVEGNEICLAPEGPLWLVPYAALLDSESKHLCDSLRIRMTPSLTTLKLISDCPADFHCKTGALLVGDPYLGEVLYKERKLSELPGARKEVEMIGDILGTDPLVGENATKVEVMKRLSSVTLVHIAAHGRIGSGEIFLAPNPTRTNQQPEEKDYLLTMKDVSQAKLRARLVVLSCCHSATGTIMAEGVVGIARAFMGAGARSVLVSLWALGDEATLEFMKHFYGELLQGKKASESLHRAMECMKKSEKYKDMMFWAPFVLLGDDVTLELTKNDTV